MKLGLFQMFFRKSQRRLMLFILRRVAMENASMMVGIIVRGYSKTVEVELCYSLLSLLLLIEVEQQVISIRLVLVQVVFRTAATITITITVMGLKRVVLQVEMELLLMLLLLNLLGIHMELLHYHLVRCCKLEG